ncbi:hypothetical protein D893_02067 [Thioalkalivibrio sp. ALE21]|nr:hypothetical protein D893_02067 [Thioalkalivibrio sp. ALE21]
MAYLLWLAGWSHSHSSRIRRLPQSPPYTTFDSNSKNSAFAGLEGGLKYYVLENTYVLGRMEYQWFFSRSSDAEDAFRDGAFAYTVGLGYNF